MNQYMVQMSIFLFCFTTCVDTKTGISAMNTGFNITVRFFNATKITHSRSAVEASYPINRKPGCIVSKQIPKRVMHVVSARKASTQRAAA